MAHAHPPPTAGLAPDAHERLADAIVLGPPGCRVADATVAWAHRSGGFATAGRAGGAWRFDDRVWSTDRFVLEEADPDSLDVRIAPLLIGTAVDVDLHYPTTRNRSVDWPGPSATLPIRLFGEIESVSTDLLEDGSLRVVRAFEWNGWKRVTGERSVTFAHPGPTVVELAATDRWPNGCSVRSVGVTTLGPQGLPATEVWRFEGHCTLREWAGEWTFVFGPWRECPAGDER